MRVPKKVDNRASFFTHSNPVIVEAEFLVQFDRGHVAFNASCFRFDRTSDVRFRARLVALKTSLDMIGWIHLANGLVRIVTRRALQLAVRFQVATTAQEPDRLESNQQVWILSDLLLANTSR